MSVLRAVSPVVATALLVLIAVAVSVLLYTWVNGMVGTQPNGVLQLQEKIKIDAVNITSNKATICVHNIGNTGVAITSAYVIDLTRNLVLGNNSNINTNLNPGSVNCDIAVNLKQTPSAGDTLLAKVVTARGTEATYVFVYQG